MDSIYTAPAADIAALTADTAVDLNAYLLQEGFVPAALDGQVVAVPLQPTAATPAMIPALVDGKVIAVPVHNPLATAAVQAQPAQAPAAPAQPVVDPGLSLAVRQYVLYGSIASLAAGGAVWMVGAAVAEVAPHADQLGHLLKWAAVLVGAVVLGLAGLLGKLRSVAATGTGAVAKGDGATANGTVLALVHRTNNTQIGKQSVWGRGSINNTIR